MQSIEYKAILSRVNKMIKNNNALRKGLKNLSIKKN